MAVFGSLLRRRMQDNPVMFTDHGADEGAVSQGPPLVMAQAKSQARGPTSAGLVGGNFRQRIGRVLSNLAGNDGDARTPNVMDYVMYGPNAPDVLDRRHMRRQLFPHELAQARREAAGPSMLTPEEVEAQGFRPGSVVQRDTTGGLDVLQAPSAGSAGGSWIEEIYTPETIDPLAYAVAMGAPVSAVSGGRNSHVAGLINRRAAEIRRELDMDPRLFGVVQAAYTGNRRAMTELLNVRNRMFSAERAALDGFRRAAVLRERVPMSEIPALNAAWLNFERNYRGSPEAVEFYNTLNEAAEEFAKVLMGATGAGGVTEGASQRSHDLFNPGMTNDQLRAAVNGAANLMTARMRGFDAAIQGVTNSMMQGVPVAPGHDEEWDWGENPEDMLEVEDREPEDGGIGSGIGAAVGRLGAAEEAEDEDLTLEELLAERERRRRQSGR